MRLSLALAFLLATITGACSVANPNHCSNQNGHTTCQGRDDGKFPHCSKCTAENDGCVATPVDDACDAGSTSEPASTTGPSTTTTTDPLPTTTATSTSSTTSTASTTDALTTTGTTAPSTTTTTESTSTTTSESTSTSDGTTDISTGTTESADSDSTPAIDMGPPPAPVCGNDKKEAGETCDGTDLSPFDSTCTSKNGTLYSGGNLKCTIDCKKFDETDCCLAPGQSCSTAAQCCSNSCLLGMGLFKCGA